MTTGAKNCRRCGELIPLDLLSGNCPRCLVTLALSTVLDTSPRPADSKEAKTRRQTPRFFGDYEILGELARGGMGIVYRARQISLNRPVALKRITAGQFATPAQVQRFQLEAEAAARLEHPNIVPIYEIGEHQGEDFYSMKLIEGGSFAARRPHRDSAALLAKIARAVHYAHQRGILHRDLKPTNILIDRDGEPHITDFGLAKLIEDNASLTQTVAVLGTPAYMAPELASGKAAEATTAADVYSIGAILYELLCGRPPFTAENVPALLRKIVEDEPAVPSGAANKIEHDLEIICLKCLAKDPPRRYASAQALAADLERWSKGEPILARPSHTPEKIWRWCHRRPALAALWTALFLALVSGLTGITWQWHRARADERIAITEANKSRQLSAFLQQMLARVGPSASLGLDTTLLREILDQTAERIERELTNQPAVAAELRDTIGRTYHDTGDYGKAIAMHREALRLRRQLSGNEHADVAQSMHLLAQALASQGDLDEAETLDNEALMVRKKLLGPEDTKVAASLNNLGNIYFRRRELSKAQGYFEQALKIYRQHDDPATAAVLNNLANVFELKPDYATAEELYREAVALARRHHGDAHPTTALYLRNLAESLRGQERFSEADAIHSEALAVRASLLDELHPLLVDSFERLALTKSQEKQWSEAETLYHKALGIRRKQSPDDPRKWSEDAYALANLLCQRKQFDESERMLAELLQGCADTNVITASLRAARGNVRARYGRWREAVSDLTCAFNLEPTNQWHALHLAALLAETGEYKAYGIFCRKSAATFSEAANPDIAQRMALSCLLAPVDELDLQTVHRMADRALDAGPAYDNLAYAIGVKALADYRSGRASNAVARLDRLLEQIGNGRFQPGRFLKIEARAILAMAHHSLGHRDEARACLDDALQLAPDKLRAPPGGDYGDGWREWLMLHVLVREASELLGAGPATPSL